MRSGSTAPWKRPASTPSKPIWPTSSSSSARQPSHIVVPALHRNKARDPPPLHGQDAERDSRASAPRTSPPRPRRYLRERFLRVPVGLSGANFAIAESGSLCVVESEGNGRMCVTLPKVLISLVGIEKIIPTFGDLEVFLQLLARSATGERMNPYNSIWTGITPGDGPQEFHVVLLDNGRTGMLDEAEIAAHARLHSLRRLPQHLSGLSPNGRPRLRLDLRRADRRHPDAAVAGMKHSPRCPTRRRFAAPATMSVRSRSIFPEFCCTCAPPRCAPRRRRPNGRPSGPSPGCSGGRAALVGAAPRAARPAAPAAWWRHPRAARAARRLDAGATCDGRRRDLQGVVES